MKKQQWLGMTEYAAHWQGAPSGYWQREELPEPKNLTLSELAKSLGFKKEMNFAGGPTIRIGIFNTEHQIVAVVSATLGTNGDFFVKKISLLLSRGSSAEIAAAAKGTRAVITTTNEREAYDMLFLKD